MVHFDDVDNVKIIVFRIEFNTVPQKNKELITIIFSSNKILTMSDRMIPKFKWNNPILILFI